jgi:pimeloyl-ACP methyl ester carboxylesterase
MNFIMSLQGVILDRPEGGILSISSLKKLAAGAVAVFVAVSIAGCSTVEAPRDLASYQAQTIKWAECDSDLLVEESGQSDAFASSKVDCATMLAPAVYTGDKEVQDFKLQMMRIHKAKTADFMGTIFINPGGPGGSGVEQVQWSDFPDELLAHYDIIGFDPRGVGASKFADGSEIKCSDKLDFVTYFSGEASPANEEEALSYVESSDAYYEDCIKRNPLWWTMSTDHVVEDLELMRQVVTGDEPLNFIGSSYGTTIAGIYVTKYPKHVGKVVLDSPTTVSADSIDSDIEDIKALEKKLEIYLANYAKYAKITEDEAWQRLLDIRQQADNDLIYGYAGIVPGPGDMGMVSSEYLITRGILALNYMPEEDAISEFNAAMDDLYQYAWNARFEWYSFNLDGYDANKLEGDSLAAKKFVRSNEFEVMAIVNSMDYAPVEEEDSAEKKKNYKLMKAAAPKWHQLSSDSNGYQYFGPAKGLSWESIARTDPAIPDPPQEPLERTNLSGKELLIVGATREAVTPFSFSKDTAKQLKSPLIAVDSSEHAPAGGYSIPCLNKILVKFFTTDEKVKSQSCPGS